VPDVTSADRDNAKAALAQSSREAGNRISSPDCAASLRRALPITASLDRKHACNAVSFDAVSMATESASLKSVSPVTPIGRAARRRAGRTLFDPE
jgi:hypothetical protein